MADEQSKGREQGKQEGKSTAQRWKQVLQSRGLTFLFFLLLSVVLWFVQGTERRYIRTLQIPLSYPSLTKTLATTSTLPASVEVQVEDKGIEHLRYVLEGLSPIPLQLSTSPETGEVVGLDATKMSEEVLKRLSATANLIYITPNTIAIPLQERVSRKVPVVLGFQPRTEVGYAIEELRLSPDSITIYGTSKGVDSIREVKTKVLSLQNLSESQTQTIALDLPSSIHTAVQQVQLSIQIEELAQKQIELPIVVLGTPEDSRLSPLPAKAVLQVTFPRSRYADFRPEDFELSVQYPPGNGGISPQTHLSVQLSKAPSWIRAYTISPSVVQYITEKVFDTPQQCERLD